MDVKHKYIFVSVPAPERKVYQGWTPCMHWCNEHCTGEWHYDTEGVFRFNSEQDATLFSLRWA